MNARRVWLCVGMAAVLAGACKSNAPADPPLGSSSGDGGTPSRDDASVPPDAAAADAADAGAQLDADAGLPFCAGHTWTTVPAVQWITGAHRFGGITPDELTIAWTSDATTIWVASRPLLSQPFAMPYTSIATETVGIADDRIALATNGLMVVAVLADRSSFVAYTKQSGGWGPAPTDSFANLHAMAMDTQAQFFEPMLGADGNFYYLFAPNGTNAGPPVMYQSTFNGQQRQWNTGVVLTSPELSSTGATTRRRPTGATLDGRTLFFFDEVAGIERMASRDSSSGAFSTFADLTAFPEAAPSGHCERLYFVSGTAIQSEH